MPHSFTPGPWVVVGNLTKYVEARLPSGLIQEVAACGPTIADEGYGQQQEANARLIAAAPDLLLYLKEARRTLEMWKDVAPAVSLCADIDAAIAKATGEQP